MIYKDLIDYGFKKSGSAFTLKLDEYSILVIEDDWSFGIDDRNNGDGVCFGNDIIKTEARLKRIYFALTDKKLIKNK